MKSAIPIAAGLALALAPVAHAQVACGELSRVSKSALGEFKDLTGKEIEDDLFSATYKLTGASECTVEFSFDTVYACLWTYTTEVDAITAFGAQVAAIGSCLATWERREDNDSGNFSDGLRYVRGSYFAGAGAESELEWGVSMEEHKTAKENDWHVWVELAYLW